MTCGLLLCRIPKFWYAKPALTKCWGYFLAAILRLSPSRWLRVCLWVVPLWLQLLQKMWRFTEFHDEYRRKGWKQSDFASGVGCVTDLSPYLSLIFLLGTDGWMLVSIFHQVIVYMSCIQNLTSDLVTICFVCLLHCTVWIEINELILIQPTRQRLCITSSTNVIIMFICITTIIKII